jgi:hypothetical protein
MPTGNDIVIAAAKKGGILGLGQSLEGGDQVDILQDLNDMIALWRRKRWLVYHLIDVAKISDGRTTPYTVGPGGDFVVSLRPAKIEAAYLRQIVNVGLPIDYPLKVLQAREQYNNLALKTLVSFSKFVFYDPSFTPSGNTGAGQLFIYPVPNAAIYEIHLTMVEVLNAVTSTGNVSLPEEYFAALKFNLAKWVRQAYGKGKSPDTELNALAKDSLDTIKAINTTIPEAVMPRQILRPSKYNIFSDQSY